VKLLYFAWVRQKIGLPEEEVAPPSSVTTVAGLVDLLRQRGPGYEAAFRDLKGLRVAINQHHSGDLIRVLLLINSRDQPAK